MKDKKHVESFRDHMAPNELHGAHLRGPNQAAMEAQDRMKERHCFPPNPAECVEQERDYKAIDRIERRKQRGGGIFRPGDGLA